jgi:hypothetical protein
LHLTSGNFKFWSRAIKIIPGDEGDEGNIEPECGRRISLKSVYYSRLFKSFLKHYQKYGLMLADIGSNMYISGAPDERWNNNELRELLQVKASDFEVVKFNN